MATILIHDGLVLLVCPLARQPRMMGVNYDGVGVCVHVRTHMHVCLCVCNLLLYYQEAKIMKKEIWVRQSLQSYSPSDGKTSH